MAEVKLEDVMKSLNFIRDEIPSEVYLEARCEFLDMILRVLIIDLCSRDDKLLKSLADSLDPEKVRVEDYLEVWHPNRPNPKTLELRQKLFPLLMAFFRLKILDDLA